MVSLTGRETAVVSQCIKCTKTETVVVKKADLMAWKKGEYIQNAMPYLEADERELLISGIHGFMLPCPVLFFPFSLTTK